MAIVKTDSYNYSSIANAIRYKNGTTNKYKPAEMANAIKALSGSGAANPTLQSKTVTPTKSSQEITYDAGYDGLEKVTVESIPDAYIQPSGTKSITSNGTYDVTNYSSANVNVESSGSDTSDATAYSEDIVKDKTAYARGTKITGTLQEKGDTNSSTVITNSPTLSTNNTTLYADAPAFTERTLYKKNASLSIGINLSEFGNADSSDVVSGKTFTSANGLKVSGTGNFISTSDATATADNIEQDYTAYVNSEKITGTVKSGNAFNLIANSSAYSNEGTVSYSASSGTGSTDMPDRISIKYTNNTKQIIPSKGTVTASAKASLFGDATVADVMAGKTFTSANGLKITGTATVGGMDMSDATATKNNIQEGKTAYISTGELVTGTLINTGKGAYLWKKYSGKVYEITKTKIGTTKPSDCSGSAKGSYDITDDGCFELSGTSYLGGYYYITGQSTDAKSIYRASWAPSTSGGNGTTTYYLWTISGEYTEGKGGFLGYISSTSDSTYPDNGMKNGYYYIKLNVSEIESTEENTSEGA